MKYKILTLNKKNITDFAKERNNLLKKSKLDWVLFLDTDEILNGPINQSFNNMVNAYYLHRKNYFLGQYVVSDKIIRLVKKGTGKWVRSVHEVWKPSTGGVGTINIPIIHNTASNLNEYIKKINYYSDLHARSNIKEGKKSNLFKIIFYPTGKFLVTFMKSKNIVFSIMQSLHSFLSWSKEWQIQKS